MSQDEDWMAKLGLGDPSPSPLPASAAPFSQAGPDDDDTLPPPLPAASVQAGWFGKVACLGDFARRRLEPDVVARLDRWLSDSLAASRQHLGEAWLDVYLGAPVWRFAWAPGVLDDHWWFGVLMPSVDNVGRYFPLWVGLPRSAAPSNPRALHAMARWHDHVNALALAMLQPDSTLEGFEHGLADAPGWPDPSPPRAQADDQHARYALGGSAFAEFTGSLALPSWWSSLSGHTLWWTQSSGAPPSHLSITAGLPSPYRFHQLLDGSW